MDFLNDLKDDPRPVVQVTSVFIGAPVGRWTEKLSQEVSMGTMYCKNTTSARLSLELKTCTPTLDAVKSSLIT